MDSSLAIWLVVGVVLAVAAVITIGGYFHNQRLDANEENRRARRAYDEQQDRYEELQTRVERQLDRQEGLLDRIERLLDRLEGKNRPESAATDKDRDTGFRER